MKKRFIFLIIMSCFYNSYLKSQTIVNNIESPLKSVLLDKMKSNTTIVLDLYVMSQCPFGVRAEEQIIPIVKEMKGRVFLKIWYIGKVDGSKNVESMHGVKEVEEDIRQLGIAQLFPSKLNAYLLARAKNYQSDNWQTAAKEVGISLSRLNKWMKSDEAASSIINSMAKSMELKIYASPTLFINGEKYMGRIMPPNSSTSTGKCEANTNDINNNAAINARTTVDSFCLNNPGSSCDDGNLCTENDVCVNDFCVGTPKICASDNNVCTTETCDINTGNCISFNNTNSCSDGNACTINDVCSNGVCASGPVRNCNDANSCTNDFCSSSLGGLCYSIARDACYNTNTWIGATSNDFGTSTNWSLGTVPTATDVVVIPTGANNMPVIVSGTHSIVNLRVQSSASITITGTLKIASTIDNAGTISAESGTIELNGTSVQILRGSAFLNNTIKNLTINNSMGVYLDGSLAITGTLTPTTGTFFTGNNLVMVSNAASTARVATGNSFGNYISGNVTVQRYIQGLYRKYRFLGHPFLLPMNLTELTDDIDITGSITGGNANAFTVTATNSPSAFTFNEANGDASINDNGWTAFESGNTVSTIAAGKGVRVLVRGSKGQPGSLTGGVYTPDSAIIDMTGLLRQGDFTQLLDFTNSSKGWNLISNPYPSNIDWTTVTKTNVNNAIYIYRPSNSSYASWINGSSTNGGSSIVELGGAFFVRANATGASLRWHETDKVSNVQPITMFREQNNIHNRFSLKLLNQVANAEDEIIIRFGDDPATDAYDIHYDAQNIASSLHDLFVLDDEQMQYSIYHGRKLEDWQVESRKIQLGLSTLRLGVYTIKFKILNELTGGNRIFLRDNMTGIVRELLDDTEYKFEITSALASQSKQRFVLEFNTREQIIGSIKNLSIQLRPNPAKGILQLSYAQPQKLNSTVTIKNTIGQVLDIINLGSVQYGIEKVDVSRFSKGVYFLQFNNGVEVKTERLLIN